MGQFLSHPLVSMISSNIPSIIQNVTGVLVNRSVEIKISNKTRSITLENSRTYLDCGRCSHSPLPELSPGSEDTCRFLGSYPFWSVPGILVYEAESFTLAIYFSNHIDSNRFPIELGLELSPGKAHLGSLEDTYTRMAHGTYSSSRLDIKFNRCVVVGNCHGSVQLSHGPIKVTATMSSDMSSFLRVELEEQEGMGEEARTDSPCRRERVQK